jgi:hypothetical protein
MKTVIDGREEIVNIDIITNYFLYQREFLQHVRTIIEGKSTTGVREQEMKAPEPPAWMDAKAEYNEDDDDEPAPATPPTKQPPKVRPVTSPPRKRAPRPKKYKIQIPKGKNPILRVPFEHDPRYNKDLRDRQAKEAKSAARKVARAAAKAAKPKVVKKPAAKKPVKKAAKKKR